MMTRTVSVSVVGVFFLLASSSSVFADDTAVVSRTIKVVVVGSGVVSLGENKCAGHCSFQYPEGKKVNLRAVPVQGWTFVEWEDDCSGSDDCTLVMHSDKSVTALFTYP